MPEFEHTRSRPVRHRRAACAAFALALLGLPAAVHAQVVIYRCTDARGELTIQNDVPCPKGSKQVKRVMEAPPPAAPYVPAPTPAPPPAPSTAGPVPAAPPPPRPPSPLDALPAATIADADRLPPPVLFECRTFDNDTYLDERGTPPPRCVTLTTTGLGGYTEGGGSACEMKTDTCQRIPDGALCEAWRRRLREAESTLRFGVSEDQARAREQLERIALVVRDSTCGL